MGREAEGVVPARSSLVEEMALGDLGDDRLNERRNRLMTVLERHPDTTFPHICADDAEVEALYRFLRNPRVTPDAILAPHAEATQRRCAALHEVLVIHDTTEMVFAGDTPRAGLTPLGPDRYGFGVHMALAVSADGVRAPLGVASLIPFVHKTRPPGTARRWRERIADPDKESRVWIDSVDAVRGRLDRPNAAIHVMDRGADSYALFATLATRGDRVVARLAQDRAVVAEDGAAATVAAAAPQTAVCERQVSVARRQRKNQPPRARQQHPPRAERVATLHVAARHFVMQRPHALPSTLPRSISVNVVYVWEAAPPDGEDPISWRLITTESIDSVDQVLQIVDWYSARWIIEEFFKALKTGCAYEKRQLESLQTLVIALALLAPIAWQLLLLRHLSRHAPTAAAKVVFSARQIAVLRAAPAGQALPPTPTIGAVLLAIARLGGHLKQNGPPGWLVLGRGVQTLLVMESGWAAAEHASRM